VALIAGGSWVVHRAGKTFAEVKHDPMQIADAFIQFYHLVESDLIWTGSGFLNYPTHFLGCALRDESSDNPLLEGSVIKSLDEIDQLSAQKVLQNSTMQGIIRSHHLVAEAIGKETLIIPTQWAPFTFAGRILGPERVMLACIKDPERLTNLIRFSTDLIWALLEPVLDHPDIPGANFSDPLASGDLISPAMFRRFAAPALKDLVERVKSKGKLSMVHICGDSTGILKDILEIGPNAFSMESKVDLKTAREVLGGKVCVAGNVSPTGAFLSGKPDQVVAEAKACLAAWGDSGGYILTVGCDFSKDVPLENAKALMSLKGSC
jgi:uroporphyrinogen decarboxylase